MKGQKQAVVDLVRQALPTFKPNRDIALVMLTANQLDDIKQQVYAGIMSGTIEYSKPLNRSEVVTYSRSMVMNHLKKAKDLNGNQVYGVGPVVQRSEIPKAISRLNMELLPEDLKSFVKTLV